MENNKFDFRPVVTAIISTLVLQGCASQNGQQLSIKDSFKSTFANDDPCANSARNIGIVAGAILGGIVGSQVSKNKSMGAVLGLGLGGALGGFIGSEVDDRQCEISKIAKKYNLDMQVTPLSVATANPTTPTSTETTSDTTAKKPDGKQKVGLSVSVIDVDGKPQFNSGSGDLQPDARVHFNEIAERYSARNQTEILGKGKTVQDRTNIYEELSKKRILLIGHTDDTGNSKLNAELSEKRAKSVAELFKSAGVGESQLYYQGAGETMPIDDNATPEGRAKNRRVEIVDLADDDSFKLYLQNKRAKTEFYRPVETASKVATIPQATSNKPAIAATSTTEPIPARKVKKLILANKSDNQKIATKQQTVAANSIVNKPEKVRTWIDFGGSPVTAANQVADIGHVEKAKAKFSFINDAQASDMRNISQCNLDRPRESGAVKYLKDDKEYSTSEYLPGVYNSSWAGKANGHLIALTHVAVLRDGNTLARKPDFLIYSDYQTGSNAKPIYATNPSVNVYRGDKAMIYRVFDSGPVQCMDVVIPNNDPKEAPNSMVYYNHSETLYSASFNPKLAK
ncbi:MAG: OmpA family protein [Methylotenera sp.]